MRLRPNLCTEWKPTGSPQADSTQRSHYNPGWGIALLRFAQARFALRGYTTAGSVRTLTNAGLPLANARSSAGRS
jgi:hypothetical protein